MDDEQSKLFNEVKMEETAPAEQESPDRELLIFGEGDGALAKDSGVIYTKPRFGYYLIAGLVGIIIGVAFTILLVSKIAGGISNLRLIKDMGSYDSSLISEILQKIDATHFGETPSTQELLDKAAHAVVDGMDDPYAEYFTVKEYTDYQSSFNGSYYGIGVVVRNPDGTGAKIIRVYDGSFAESAGLKKDDLIIAVDGKDVKNVSGTELVSLITGEEGTTVDITFLRDGEEMTLTVTRGAVYVKRVDTGLLDNGIGYIYLVSFSGNAVEEFRTAFEELKSQGAKKFIIDLRDDPGGSLNIVVDICDMLLPKCTICSMQGKTTDPTRYFDSDAKMYDEEFVVLVNGYSASASEIFAGAMQDNGRAKIIGTQTYGKGVVQTTFPLEGTHGFLKLTTDAYFTPNGTNLGGTGITPDIVVELPEELAEYDIYTLFTEHIEEDTQIQAAIKELLAD